MRVLTIALLLVLTAAATQAQPAERVAGERWALEVDPAAGTLALEIRDADGTTIRRVPMPGLHVDGMQQSGFAVTGRDPLRLGNGAVTLTVEPLDAHAVAVTWTLRDGARRELALHLTSDDPTRYYGTGERFNALNQRGYLLPMNSDDRYGNKGVGTHKPVPFVMSNRGYGLWVDSFAPGTFDLDGSERFGTVLRFPETRLRVVFFTGSMPEILDAFTARTGRPHVPPPWAFGLWKSRDVHHNQDSVLVDVDKLRRHRIPATVLVLDSPWETGYNDFIINRQQFPDPEAMARRIQGAGLYLCLWLTPFVNSRNVQDMTGIDARTQTFDAAAAAGYLVEDSTGAVAEMPWWKGTGGLVDFTDPAAVRWWLEQLAQTQILGARAFKADDGEGNFVPDAVFHDGSTALEMTNRYAALYDSVMQAYVDEQLGGDGVLLTRSGYTGTQQYPFDWAGDNRGDFSYTDGLPSVILASQNAALSGIPLWGADIAGYAGPPPTKEVFIRWTQFAAFTPFMQVHMTSNLGPWDFDDEALRIFRDYTRLRTRFFPYLYEAVHEASATGMPLIRPMALAYTEDDEAQRHPYQYLFGPDLLVAPMHRPGTHRAVYLPEGGWIDFWSGEALEGGQAIEVEAPLDRLPLFVRAGALISTLPDDVETLIERHDAMDADVVALDDRRVLEVWPGTEGRLVLTWDGLAGSLSTASGQATLTITSDTARPLAVHLPHQQVVIEAPGATTRYDAERQRTVVTFDAPVAGTRTLTWKTP